MSEKESQTNCGSSHGYRALPHELFCWCVQQGMPEGECRETADQIKWLQKHVWRLNDEVRMKRKESKTLRRLVTRAYRALHSGVWQDCETDAELSADIDDKMSDLYGAEWSR